jgi:hypothetical protein
MVTLFEVISPASNINIIVFWGVAPCNLVDYTKKVVEYVILLCM